MPQTLNILIAEARDFSPVALGMLGGLGRVILADAGQGELRALVPAADVLWVRLGNRIDSEIMDAAPRLRIIVTATTGLNHIDMEEAARRRIRVLSLGGAREFLNDVRATAEHAVGLMLALMRNVPAAARHVRAGGWDRDAFRGRELYGKTVGVVGYGRLGRIVARYLAAFETTVLAADPFVKESEAAPNVQLLPLHRLLIDADIVTIHVPFTSQTANLFSRLQFALMRRGSWLVNTSRGEVVDEAALLDALRSGKLAGAAVDVLAGEHAAAGSRSPLIAWARRHENLLITPHIGGCTAESMEKTEVYMAGELARALAEPAPELARAAG